MQTPPGGSGARVNGSAFDRPCEGAVVCCAWGGDPTFLHGESGCKRHLEDRVPGSMEARLADLVKARLFAFGAGTPICRVASLGAHTTWRTGCQGMEARLANLVKARLFAHGAGTPPLRKLQSWAPPASSLRKLHSCPPTGIFVVGNHSHGPHRRLRCPELHSWAPVGVFAVPNHTHGPRKASSSSETAVTGPYVSEWRLRWCGDFHGDVIDYPCGPLLF